MARASYSPFEDDKSYTYVTFALPCRSMAPMMMISYRLSKSRGSFTDFTALVALLYTRQSVAIVVKIS